MYQHLLIAVLAMAQVLGGPCDSLILCLRADGSICCVHSSSAACKCCADSGSDECGCCDNRSSTTSRCSSQVVSSHSGTSDPIAVNEQSPRRTHVLLLREPAPCVPRAVSSWSVEHWQMFFVLPAWESSLSFSQLARSRTEFAWKRMEDATPQAVLTLASTVLRC